MAKKQSSASSATRKKHAAKQAKRRGGGDDIDDDGESARPLQRGQNKSKKDRKQDKKHRVKQYIPPPPPPKGLPDPVDLYLVQAGKQPDAELVVVLRRLHKKDEATISRGVDGLEGWVRETLRMDADGDGEDWEREMRQEGVVDCITVWVRPFPAFNRCASSPRPPRPDRRTTFLDLLFILRDDCDCKYTPCILSSSPTLPRFPVASPSLPFSPRLDPPFSRPSGSRAETMSVLGVQQHGTTTALSGGKREGAGMQSCCPSRLQRRKRRKASTSSSRRMRSPLSASPSSLVGQVKQLLRPAPTRRPLHPTQPKTPPSSAPPPSSPSPTFSRLFPPLSHSQKTPSRLSQANRCGTWSCGTSRVAA